ncbi:hypothetical protein [Sulfuracidifex tepidarius]|uniref:Uncharacterized protein n=1 Tax=Sulfuracidifex tepidarius TaxID=1294262 RepID=A0A510DS45_9CREN|nr:hypothetical protein [Sulfuracidifex tepidarius]BBG22974.1 hypothetical protein IC006_0258 [Sulfuracidifex tepidarius]BBG25735.1 hypothetical protein IC007_0240 [Sulfuracidifex tepidarius]
MTEYNLLNFNEVMAKITIMKVLNESESATFLVDDKLKGIVEEIAEELEMEKNEVKEGDVLKITVYPKMKDAVSKATLIEVDTDPKLAYNVIKDPTILIAIIPQIKSVTRMGENTYTLRIKWVLSWDTPLTVNTVSLKETSFTVKYNASQKIAIAKVSFGFDFLIFGISKEKCDIKIKEWYSGPFSSLAKGEIEKHLANAENQLPSLIIQHRS